jgi:sugar phosphate isomerase/epimerase
VKLSFVLSTQPTQFAAVAFSPDLEPQLAHLASLGYDGAELAVREPAKLDANAVKQMLAAHHLSVPALGTGQAYVEEHLSFTDPDPAIRARAIERVESHIALAREFDALVILGLIRGKAQPGIAREQTNAWMVDALKSLTQTARAQNVRLVLEPINRYETDLINTAADALDVITQVGADNLGILFDTFHANIEEPRIEVSLRVCGRHLFHVHVADSNRWFPGAGHTDFTRVITTLREMKYTGWVSAEILPKPDVRRAAEQTMRTMKPLL